MSAITSTSSLLGNVSYKLTSPLFETDATGGTTTVVNNAKFNTNVPIDKAIAITEVDWIVSYLEAPTPPSGAATQTNNWPLIGQLTEALSRTTPTLADNVDIDIYLENQWTTTNFQTAAGFSDYIYDSRMERHVFRHPWLTVAQQLNLIGQAGGSEQQTQTGPEIQWGCRIFFQLVDLTADFRSYLATRIQIAGQA